MSPCLPRGNELLHRPVVCRYIICTFACIHAFECSSSVRVDLDWSLAALDCLICSLPPLNLKLLYQWQSSRARSHQTSNNGALRMVTWCHFMEKLAPAWHCSPIWELIFFSLLEMGQQRIPAYWGNENIRQHTMPYYTAVLYLDDLGWLGFKRLAASCPSTILWKDSLKVVAYIEDVCLVV